MICGLLTATAAFAQVPGGTLDPQLVPKYVTPLVIPPVLHDDLGGAAPLEAAVALRQFAQQVLPTSGCLAASAAQTMAGGPPVDCVGDAFPPTVLWGYGDPARPGTFNNPAFTFEVTKDTTTWVRWINDLVDESGASLPHVLRDADGVPIIDQTLHWSAPNGPVAGCLDGAFSSDCRGATDEPYWGPVPMVVHVHGAHVPSDSDGYPEAWWLPAANDIPAGYARAGTHFDDATGSNPGDLGYADFRYPNDQPTATLWYHDHALGITRLNVHAASAGFWLVRTAEDGETGLVSGVLPGPPPRVGDTAAALNTPGDPVRGAVREIPIAIQPKSFNADGSQFYPANRAFFEELGDGRRYDDNSSHGLEIPFLPDPDSDVSPVWNPEAFFNTMVVNGTTWPLLEVAPERYRFRLLNASDSRFLNLSLVLIGGNGKRIRELPFYQIGTEQGLLPYVVRVETGSATPLPGDGRDVHPNPRFHDCLLPNGRPMPRCVPTVPGTYAQQALLMAPAERADVIVDLSGLTHGDLVLLRNTGPDEPFGGFPDADDADGDVADPATTGQVMLLRVDAALATPGGDPSTPPAEVVLDAAAPAGAPPLTGVADVSRDLALLERESEEVCVEHREDGTIVAVAGSPPDCPDGSEPFGPQSAVLGVAGATGGLPRLWSSAIGQNPALGALEEWQLWNHSADAHPIHLHLVKFQVVDRQAFDEETFALGEARPPEAWEVGWKDTVIAYPGEVTRVRAVFDLAGLYVWHCHILSHEDNEMMLPYCVGEPGVDCPAELFE